MGTKAKLQTKVFKNRSEIYYNMKNSKQKVLNSFKNIASALELVSNLVRTEKLRRLKARKFPRNSLKFSHKC